MRIGCKRRANITEKSSVVVVTSLLKVVKFRV